LILVLKLSVALVLLPGIAVWFATRSSMARAVKSLELEPRPKMVYR
jgi:hypothetical protein